MSLFSRRNAKPRAARFRLASYCERREGDDLEKTSLSEADEQNIVSVL